MQVHGIVFAQLRNYVSSRLGRESWSGLVEAAGAEHLVYLPTESYPDSDMSRLVAALSARTQESTEEILHDFGVYLAGPLLGIYGPLLDAQWRTLDLLEHTEKTIHTVIRMQRPNAAPPRLDIERVGPETVRIVYTSPRRLCDLARGIVRGMANHYRETVDVEQPSCMHRGDPACVLLVRLTSRAE
jgi:predicted hydrocarbon binding protein